MGTVRRQFWQGIEVIHDVVYFGDDIRERFDAIGLKGWWMAYFAQRSAALGTPDPKTVTALFHGFAPQLVERALPDAWSLADRDEILATRLKLAVDRLTPVIDPAAIETDVMRLAKDLEAIVDGLDFAGRALAAAHANLPRPNDPIERLWLAATVLREYRGDSHVAILVAAGLDGAAANTLAVADGRAPARQQQARGWNDDAWMAAYEHLRRRAWCTEVGEITDAGKAARAQIEDATDRVSSACFDEEMQARAITTERALVELARAINSAGAVPFPNPTATFLP
jgi:hypothetical protein